ncbi:MAG: lamin tail domain-containing protein, partial [Limisphaerales bacterium]
MSAAAIAQTNFPVQLENNVSLVGSLNHPALIESSGLTASKQHPGVLWTHNDDGEPFIFAMNRRGEHLGAFEVKGANLIDWEAISADDHGNLYLADIGTNGLARTHSAIHRVEEPDPADEWGPAEVEQTWLIRFPGEREDCESFFVLDGYGYLVTKYPRGRALSIYRFLLGSSSEYTLELVARFPRLATVSDAALSPDKQRLALLTSEGVDVYFINGDPASISSGARADTEFDEPDMEGIAFVPDGLLVTFDSRPDVLLFDSVQLTGAPEITEPLQDRTAFVGSDVTFEVEATGFPAVSYTWIFNGGLLRGQTSPQLVLTNVTLADAGLYEVIVSNARGTARSSATLTVLERTVDVRITEVMSSEAPGNVAKADWWELTSFDTQPVNLGGWRFNDSTGGITNGFRIPDGTIIQPGESIVFVEGLTPGQFRAWWGTNNLLGIQIITYSGTQLSFNAALDTLRLWTNETTDEDAPYDEVTFGPADVGVSFGYDPVAEEFGEKSQVGVNGAFVAAAGSDIGSPGRIRNAIVPVVNVRITEVMSSQALPTTGKADWWELTSFDTQPVNLGGWRFNDGTGGLNDAFVIPTNTVINPGESIIFVENLTPAEFLIWWGADNISPATQIITYAGAQLSFNAQGDILRLWTDEAVSDADVYAEERFEIADEGVSFGYDPATGEFGGKS